MKCKCTNEMIKVGYDYRELGFSPHEIIMYWCKHCGRLARVQEVKPPLVDWYDPDILPWQLKPRQPYKQKVEKEYGVCEYNDCDRKATWEVCATNCRAAMRCGRHKTGEGLTLDMRRIKKPKVHKSKK